MSYSPCKSSRCNHRLNSESTTTSSSNGCRRTSLGDNTHAPPVDSNSKVEENQHHDEHASPSSRRRRRGKENNLNKSQENNDGPDNWRSPQCSNTRKNKHDNILKNKSYGLSPGRFHHKKKDLNHTNDSTDDTIDKNGIPQWKQTVERDQLIQHHKQHTSELERQRKVFRQRTVLKTWPLQDMAMEHLDHLLFNDLQRQFHGGDYLSADSSSSNSSVEKSRLRQSSLAEESKSGIEESKSGNGSTFPQYPLITVTSANTTPLWSLEPRIFAIEKSQGKRKYLVGQFGRIADWYWRKVAPPRHLYEVIREATPCRLYFDLEYSKVFNHDEYLLANTHQLLQELQDELATDLMTYYGLTLTSSQIINLDSSSDIKFSRHWIIHLMDDDANDKETNEDNDIQKGRSASRSSEVLFKDAPTTGRFVKRLIGRLAEERVVLNGDFAERRPMLAKYLFVNTKEVNKPSCFIDLSVYTRNRLFRCLGSSKFGKSATLQAVLQEGTGEDERTYFPISLPPNRKLDWSQSSKPLSIDDFVAANDWEPHAKALADSLIIPLKKCLHADKETKACRLLYVDDESYGGVTNGTLLGSIAKNMAKSDRASPTVSMAKHGSRLPSLDKFVEDVLALRGGTQGSIRAWSVDYGPRDTPISITYHMQKNRFCELIGRSHKSNNIFWSVDFDSWTCLQGCHDPECFGRGSPVPIPNEDGRLESIKKELQAWEEEEFEKALLSLNIDDLVAQATADSKQVKVYRQKLYGPDNGLDDVTISDDALLQAISMNPELFP